jgi:predicted nuclease of predicted toxin-antitoxin system
MKVCFQADADLNAEIVAGVLPREPGTDFQTADEASLRRLPDPEVLALAAQENRILVTHDRRTMPRHFADFILHHSSPGVFIIAQTVSVRVAIEELLLVWAASESEEWTNLIVEPPLSPAALPCLSMTRHVRKSKHSGHALSYGLSFIVMMEALHLGRSDYLHV